MYELPEEHIAFRYQRIRALRLSLLVLSFSWITAPIAAHLMLQLLRKSNSSLDNPSLVLLYPTFVILLSSAMLGKSAKTIREKVKIMSIPLSFIVCFFVGYATSAYSLGSSFAVLGSVGIFICPLWAAEIVRQRAHEYGKPKYNVLLLVLNHLAVIWLLMVIVYPWLNRGGWVALSMLGYLTYVVGFIGLRRSLSEQVQELELELKQGSESN